MAKINKHNTGSKTKLKNVSVLLRSILNIIKLLYEIFIHIPYNVKDIRLQPILSYYFRRFVLTLKYV